MRRVWQDYFPAANGIAFLIDASNKASFAESRIELEVRGADKKAAFSRKNEGLRKFIFDWTLFLKLVFQVYSMFNQCMGPYGYADIFL